MIINVGKYNIIIEKNSLENINNFINFSEFSNIIILTDENIVNNNWLEKLLYVLPKEVYNLIIKSGEKYKNLDTVANIWETMNNYKLDRKSLLINLGGGIVSDLGGFCASTYMRGIKFLNIPTTLLSQVDASVGGKTGFDYNSCKNLIGSFAEPYKVVIDSSTLSTLPEREFNSGMAEVIKYGIIYDKDFFDYLESENIDIDYVIKKCCEIKADVVNKDFKEGGLRKILNFGHTIGHAIETLSLETKSPLLHGEAVALGIVAICYIASKIGKINDNNFERIKNILKKYNLQTSYNGLDIDEVYNCIKIGVNMELESLRKKVDECNKKILEDLKERFEITREIGILKNSENLPAYDPKREELILEKIGEIAKIEGLNENMVKDIFKIIMKYVVEEHKEIKNKK